MAISKWLHIFLLLVVLLFTPYAIKNLLMGLPEWLTVILLMLTGYNYIVSKHKYTAIFILGLIPFFRQNLLITVLLLAVWILINNSNKIKLLSCFIIPLLLPVYHNLYYAGDWRFFVDIFQLPFLSYSDTGNAATKFNYTLIANNIIHYFGFDIINGKISFSLIAAIFLPLAVVIYFMILKEIKTIKVKFYFLLISMSAIVPVIFLGTGYYPRFEFVNIVVVLITYFSLSQNESSPVSTGIITIKN